MNRMRKALAVVVALTGICAAGGTAVMTAAAAEITIRSEAVPEARAQELPLPEDTYREQDREYCLKSYQQVETVLPEIAKNVQKTVLYEGVEAAAGIPASIEVSLDDEETGRSAPVQLPLQSTAQMNGRWSDGFTFPVTVWGYDAGSFVLGGETVPVAEEHPFAGHENALLELIGVDPACYRIDSAEWSGQPQAGEDGLIYRQATAVGQKYLSDVEAVYGGQAVIPAQTGIAYEAVYVLKEEEKEPTPAVTETEAPVAMTAAPIPAAAAAVAAPPAIAPEKPAELRIVLKRLRQVTTVVVGLGLLMGPMMYLLIRKRRKA